MDIILALGLIILVFGSTALLMIRHGYLPSPLDTQKKTPKAETVAGDVQITKNTGKMRLQSAVKSNSKTYAFIIGADSYADISLQRLEFTKSDAERIAFILKRNYSLEKLVLLTGEHARRESILREIRVTLKRVTKNDNVLLYFSGHGFYKEQSGESLTYYGTYDTDPNRLEETAISAKNIQEFLSNEIAGRMLFILDACYSGTSLEQLRSKGVSEIPQFLTLQAHRAIITSRTLQAAKLASYRKYQRFFTKYLLEGLSKGISPESDLVRIRDLYYFINDKLDEEDLDLKPILQSTSGENFPLLIKKTEIQE